MTSNPLPPGSPIPAVSVLVIDAGRILLVRRAHEPNRGLWALPGGRIEPGERAEAAAVRAVRAETGIAIDRPEPIDTVEVTVDGSGGQGRRYSIAVFRARYASGLPVAGDDAAEARWVNPGDLSDLPLTEGTRAVVAKYGAETTDA
jgi:ADP-ribose pyrophosphatase YjhB (NUDIX family)